MSEKKTTRKKSPPKPKKFTLKKKLEKSWVINRYIEGNVGDEIELEETHIPHLKDYLENM
jgi:hypothetical protein